MAVASLEEPLVAEEGGPKPAGFEPTDAPFAGGNGFEQLREVFEEQQEQAQAREEALASPELQAEREESQSDFVGVSDAAAEALVEEEFGRELDGLLAVPDLDDLLDGRRVERFVDDHTAVLAGGTDGRPVLLESPRPLRAAGEDGRKRPVDLSLEPSGDGYVPENAAADVTVPDDLADGFDVGPATVTPAGAADGELSGEGGERVVYANAQPDTDVIVAAVTQGVEVFWQLRSPRAPEELVLDLELPAGAVTQTSDSGSIAVVEGGETLATVSAPVALDAQGQDVAVDMEPLGDRIVLSVAHQGEDVAYPILVDPVWEDWYGDGTETWFHQDPAALAGLSHWFHTYSGVPANTYAPRYDCYVPVSCYRFGPAHNDALADGLHMYVRANTAYPAGSAAQWLYQPPGTTTRINRADLGVKYLRMRSGSTQSPVMFTGIWRVGGPWLTSASFNQDFSNHWNAHFAGGQAGPQQLVFGFFAPVAVSGLPIWRDGYVGSAIVELTDPEAPTITNKGLTRSDGGDPAKWAKGDPDFLVRPTATDPGLGAQYFEIVGAGVVPGSDYAVHPTCTGTKSAPCPSSWTAPTDQTMVVATDGLPEGINNVDLYAEDAIGHRSGTYFPVKIDRGDPGLTLSGALWNQREVTPTPPLGGQPVLSAGQHQLHISATDHAQGGSRAGVEKVEVMVDGDSVTVDQGACPAGNCSRELDWTFDTAEFGGRSNIEVIATDGAGNTRTQSFTVNAPARGQLLSPVDGETTSHRIALQAQANEDGFTGVQFQYRRMPDGAWLQLGDSGDSLHNMEGELETGGPTGHPLDQPGRRTEKLIWDAKTALALLIPKPGPIQLRAVFSGNGTYKSQPVNAELDEKGLSAGNATEAIGPGTVDLLTGNFSYGATDASLSGFGQSMSVTRTFNSLNPSVGAYGPLGPGWVTSAPVDGISDYSSLSVLTEPALAGWVDVFDSAGSRIRFEKLPDGTYKPEIGAEALKLAQAGTGYTLTDLDGTVTTFSPVAGTTELFPSKVEEAGSQGVTSFKYELLGGKPQLKRIVAPTPPSFNCAVALNQLVRGCKVLELEYTQVNLGSLGSPYRLTSIRHVAWDPAISAMRDEVVAQLGYYPITAGPAVGGRLQEAWDPRISPALKETYSYDANGRLASVTPPGEAPWSMTYQTSGSRIGALASASRTAAGSGTEAWRPFYDVPLSGGQAPYQMAADDLDGWGQTDRPTDATAILPPNESGTSFTRAVVHYLNHDGRIVNTATPGGAIATAEYDPKGNVVRELSPANRAKALAIGEGSATLAGLLSTYRTYSADGLRMLEELGPEREVKLDSGEVVEARAHTVTAYDEGSTLPSSQAAHLPTTVTAGAQVEPSEPDEDVRVTKTEYDWPLRKPTSTITDAGSGGLNITDRAG